MSQNKAKSYTRVSTDDQQSQAAQLEITRKADQENGLSMNPGIRGQTTQRSRGQPASVPADDRRPTVGRKALRHHHRL